MPETASGWTRHLVYRAERRRTTWKLRLGVLSVAVLAMWLPGDWWTVAIGRSLVCAPERRASDAIFVENFDTEYPLFERARDLRRAGLAQRILIRIPTDASTSQPNDVYLGVAEVMARISRLGPYEIVPTKEVEPISLNVAWDVLKFLKRERIQSVIVVTSPFRSRRSALVYTSTLGRAGIAVSCEAAPGSYGEGTWPHTWHGVQDVIEQWIKLQYYRWYVLPFLLNRQQAS